MTILAMLKPVGTRSNDDRLSSTMIPVGYMVKRVLKKPDWLRATNVADIYSVSSCCSEDFTDYINHWKHNGYWLFDSPEIIRTVAKEHSIPIDGTSLFYYEAHELEFDGENWKAHSPEASLSTNVVTPFNKQLEGFDVVTSYAGNAPEHSPLSCNSLAKQLHTNAHCLFASFDEAERNIKNGAFKRCEAGPYRILSVYSVPWP
jgi:hypothetical protein